MMQSARARIPFLFGKTSRIVCLVAAFAIATPALADIVTVDDMVTGIQMTAAQCSAKSDTVWVTAKGRNFCMRYYFSNIGDGKKPIIFLQGDRLGVLNMRTGKYALPPGEKDINTDDLMRAAVSISRQTKTSAIYLGRIGVEGSSGDHRMRHSLLELYATNAALDAIKQKHNFEGFHLMGQSGGAHLVAGLLGLRNDVGCAVIGSGPLNPDRRLRLSGDPMLDHFNPLDMRGAITLNKAARIIVVTDPSDKKVGEQAQSGFVRAVEQTGRPIEQYMVQAVDENRHGVVNYSRLVMTGCLRSAKTEEITQDVGKLVQRAAAFTASQPGRGDANRSNAASQNQPSGQSNSQSNPALTPATPYSGEPAIHRSQNSTN
jgi:hypothetical protein